MSRRRERQSIDLYALNNFLESIRSYTEELIFGPAQGEFIYHYTNLDGLNGIIQHHDLWLTHSKYSNDDEEITHGYRIVKEVIAAKRADAKGLEWLDYLDNISRLLDTSAAEGVYICCFCLDDNLLSQWRGYGANGTGVCIKFNPGEFAYITGPDSPQSGLIRLWKVFYEIDRQRNIIQQAIDFAFNNISLPIEDRALQAVDAIQFFIPTFKNEDFREERECRLIFTPSPGCTVKPDFRVARGMLVPYFRLQELSGASTYPRYLPIKGVRVGPSINKHLNVESIQMLLLKAGYLDVEVESSDTPYRG